MGSENGSMLEKECVSHFQSLVVIQFSYSFFYYYHLVEAHSPFVQCVAWAPAPLTEGSEDADRILNVVATGGTDKVNIRNYTHTTHIHSQITAGDQNMATLIIKVLACSGLLLESRTGVWACTASHLIPTTLHGQRNNMKRKFYNFDSTLQLFFVFFFQPIPLL